MNTDLYAVIGVGAEATADEIASAYKALARELHPDVAPDDPAAEERFKNVTAAYDVLGDETKRAEYDQFRSMVGPNFSVRADDMPDAPDFEDLLGGLFGAGASFGGFSGNPFTSARSMRMVPVTLTLHEAAAGAEVAIGLASGPSTISIPAGVPDGAQLVVRTPDEDVVVQINIDADDRFAVDGRHLRTTVTVPFVDAALGGTMRVPTLDGGSVKVKVPAGSQSGRTFRVAGRGLPGPNGAGDLLATIAIGVPVDLTDEQQDALRAFSATLPAAPVDNTNPTEGD